MPIKTSRATTDSALRSYIFDTLDIANIEGFQKVNDRQWGIILKDTDGNDRYVRVGIIVSELRDGMTAQELMESEIQEYKEKQAKKAAKASERAAKAEHDKTERARKAAEKAAKKGE